MIRNIIFDFDGVILDSIDCKTDAFIEIYKEHGIDIVNKVRKYHLENGGISRYEKFKYWHENYLGIRLNSDQVDNMAKRFSKIVVKNVISSEEIYGSFQFIKNYSSKYKYFIISGTPIDEMKFIINKIGLSNHFIEVLGSPTKKDKWCKFLKNKYKLIDNETIFLGDAIADYDAAKNNKFHFALRKAKYNRDLFNDLNPDIIFSDFFEFENKIKKYE